MRKAKWLPLEALQPYLLNPASDAAGALDWAQVFANDRPVELEVGFGKGTFLVETSQSHPDVNYVGIEIDRGLTLYVAGRVAKRKLANVRLVCADAGVFIRDHVGTASLHAVHVYFPDPWWKQRHRKRRVFTADFAAELARSLAPGGHLHLATDVEEYFTVMLQIVAQRPELIRVESVPSTPLVPSSEGVTNFQRKALAQGRQVWRATFRKCAFP